MQRSQAGARGSISTNGSTSTSSSSRRRPHVWQDDMAEVKETFRRVARARHRRSAYFHGSEWQSSPPRVTAPMLSRNRRARIRCQVPSSGFQVPVKVLQEIQGNRSQSPFVSLNHLQNVLGMCRRIRSQQSVTERKKNPHDPSVYPVYVRRPWSVSAGSYPPKGRYPNPATAGPKHVSPTSSCSPPLKQHHHAQASPTSQHHLVQQSSSQSAEAISLPHDVSPSSLFMSPLVSPNCRQRAMAQVVSPSCLGGSFHVGPSDRTPLYYRPARFKHLYDISNGVFPHTQIRKRASCSSSLRQDKVRMCAKEKPSWTHYRDLISHPSMDDTLTLQQVVSPNLNLQSQTFIPISTGSLHFHPNACMDSDAGEALHRFPWHSSGDENFIITKKARTLRPSPMGFSESWPSSSSCFSNEYHHHHLLSDPQAHLKLMQQGLDSDRRPHSENDLNLHSASYLLERPPSRCMKRPLSSSFSWRNVGDLQLSMSKSPLDFGFVDAWSANSSISQQECSIFIPRDLNGNILKPLPSSTSPTSKGTSMRFKQRYCPKSKSSAGYKSTSFAGALMGLSRRHREGSGGGQQYGSKQHMANNTNFGSKNAGNPNLQSYGAKSAGNPNLQSYSGNVRKKKKPINFSSTSCLDDLEGLPPSKWAKRLASDLMATPYGTKSKAGDFNYSAGRKDIMMSQKASTNAINACFNNGFKHRVKFASPSVQTSNEGFRKEAQSLASTEMSIPDLLSWERDSGLLTGDPPSVDDHGHGEQADEEPDQQLLEQVEAMLAASSSSSSSPSPSPYSQLMSTPSPLQSHLPVRNYMDSSLPFHSPALNYMDSSWSKSLTEMRPHSADDMPTKSEVHILQGLKKDASRSFQKQNWPWQWHAKEDRELKGTISADNVALGEAVKDGQMTEHQFKQAIDSDEQGIKDAVEAAPEITDQRQGGKEAIDIISGPHELSATAGSLISIHHKTALIEAMENNFRSNGANLKVPDVVVLQGDIDDDDDDDDEEMKEAKSFTAAAPDAEWELEKLFQDSLDLNPTLRHIYDSMSFLNSRVSPDPCSFTIS
ncbi:hypothetical protein GOP47_0027846 [Adiantum capillus-veneris]|nr:hypothetical protein GOP47_0027846 [Adiantum capillus-veneris]